VLDDESPGNLNDEPLSTLFLLILVHTSAEIGPAPYGAGLLCTVLLTKTHCHPRNDCRCRPRMVVEGGNIRPEVGTTTTRRGKTARTRLLLVLIQVQVLVL
jgi:hypothetical protein